MKQRVILSPARAQAILERVADRFGLKPAKILQARADTLARAARIEAAHALKAELNWSQRRIAAFLRCSKTTVLRMLRERARLVAAFQGRVAVDHEAEAETIAEMREKLNRVCGADLADELTEAYDVPKRCGIVLAILAEAYPRTVAIEGMCELYDDACQRLDYGFQRGADRELIRKHVSDLNRAFAAKGLPLPSMSGAPVGGRRLTDKMAARLSEKFGVPRASKLLLAAERRHDRKPELRLVR